MNLTTQGIIFWILGWSIVIGLVAFCFYKILRNTSKNDFNRS